MEYACYFFDCLSNFFAYSSFCLFLINSENLIWTIFKNKKNKCFQYNFSCELWEKVSTTIQFWELQS